MTYVADITVCARVIKYIEADSEKEAQKKAERMIGYGNEKAQHEFCESVRDKLMLCEPEICDLYKD